jgi:hypothetical protein|tara:strand:+ start:231 stop:440 length:210 start_codon:yes stop_codon:yes gene_type:complete
MSFVSNKVTCQPHVTLFGAFYINKTSGMTNYLDHPIIIQHSLISSEIISLTKEQIKATYSAISFGNPSP